MSTLMLVNPDDSTVFPYISEEELAQPFQSSITEEEFTAFLLSVTSCTTKFDLSHDLSFSLDTNPAIDDMIAFTNQTLSSEDITTTNQTLPNSDIMASGNITPIDFIVECGLDPADFKSLQTPASSGGDPETWKFVLHEMLDKMTEWVKTTDSSLREIGVSVEELQNFGPLDDVQFSI